MRLEGAAHFHSQGVFFSPFQQWPVIPHATPPRLSHAIVPGGLIWLSAFGLAFFWLLLIVIFLGETRLRIWISRWRVTSISTSTPISDLRAAPKPRPHGGHHRLSQFFVVHVGWRLITRLWRSYFKQVC